MLIRVNETIILRPLSARDADTLFLLVEQSREHVQKWLPWLKHIQSSSDALFFITNEEELARKQKSMILGIFMASSCIGVIGFHQLDFQNKIGSLGYFLEKQYEGKGIMTQSATALISYAFFELKLNRIELRIATENAASNKLAKRLGFIKEGILRQVEWLETKYVDHVVYGLLKEEWEE